MWPKQETERCLSAELCSRCRVEGQREAAAREAHAKHAQTLGRCHTQGRGEGGGGGARCHPELLLPAETGVDDNRVADG